MSKILFLMLALIVSAQSTFARETAITSLTTSINEPLTDAHIVGHVVDKSTGEHLPYITIRLLKTSIGTSTDATSLCAMCPKANTKSKLRASAM